MIASIEQIAIALRRGPIVLPNGKQVFEIDARQPTVGELAKAKRPVFVPSQKPAR